MAIIVADGVEARTISIAIVDANKLISLDRRPNTEKETTPRYRNEWWQFRYASAECFNYNLFASFRRWRAFGCHYRPRRRLCDKLDLPQKMKTVCIGCGSGAGPAKLKPICVHFPFANFISFSSFSHLFRASSPLSLVHFDKREYLRVKSDSLEIVGQPLSIHFIHHLIIFPFRSFGSSSVRGRSVVPSNTCLARMHRAHIWTAMDLIFLASSIYVFYFAEESHQNYKIFIWRK